MMTNCPKCGFSQEQDQYCASCGVNMLTYKPARKPFHVRLVSSSLFQLSALALVVAVLFVFVRRQQSLQLDARINDIESGSSTKIVEKAKRSATTLASTSATRRKPKSAPAPVAAAVSEPVAPVPAPPARDVSQAATVSSSSTAALATDTNAGGASAAPAAAAPDSAAIRVSFNEAPMAVLSALSSDPDTVGGDGPIQYGVALDWATQGKAARSAVNWRSLDATDPQSIKVSETTSVFRGPRDPKSGLAYGISIYTKLIKVDDTGATIQVDLSRNILDPNATGGVDQITRLPLPPIHVVKGGAIYITGLLPHHPISPNEASVYRGDRVMQILSSEPFRAGFTDLAVFIEPR